MIDAVAVASLGFVLGMRHATDADHVVAVATIVARHGSVGRAARVGALWGVGHSLTLLVVGGALVASRVAMPPRLGLACELAVAVMLVALGARTLRPDALRRPAGRSAPATFDPPPAPVDDRRRPLLVGTVHGLAGSAAVALLALTAIPSPTWAIAYLLVFGAGTVAGMMLVTTLVAAPAALAGPRLGPRLRRARAPLRVAAGALSVALGVALARGVVVDGGLFAATPHWTPH